MTDERDKLPGRSDSAKNTAREVPLARPLSSMESVPKALRGQRLEPGLGAPERLRSEDVEFAVLREVEPRPKRLPLGAASDAPGPRAAKSDTLLSMGSIDPRAPTERSLETPRMFMTRAETEAEVYFTPKPAPRATEHATIEIETVKIAESADPRRAVTQPRLRSPDPQPPMPERIPASAVTSQDLHEPTADEVSTTPEPLAKRRDEQQRARPLDTLDPKKVSTQPELPRHRRNSEAPTIRISHSVPPAEIPATAEHSHKSRAMWLWVAGATALVALLLVWLVRSRPGKPADNAAAVQTPAPAPMPVPQPVAKTAAAVLTAAEEPETLPLPAASRAPLPSSLPKKAVERPAKAPEKSAASTERQSIY